MQKDNDVIDFQVHKVTIQKKHKSSPKQMPQGENRRLTVAASLFSVVIMVFWLNQEILQPQTESINLSSNQGRGIASYGEALPNSESPWKKSLVQQLTKNANTSFSTRGTKPSDLDRLTFGVLAGKYTVSEENGRVNSLKLRKEADAKVVSDLPQFLSSLKGFLPVEFASVEQVTSAVANAQMFALFDASQTKVGSVLVKLDADKGLQSLDYRHEQKLVKNQTVE